MNEFGKCGSCRYCGETGSFSRNDQTIYARKCLKSGHEYIAQVTNACADYEWDGKTFDAEHPATAKEQPMESDNRHSSPQNDRVSTAKVAITILLSILTLALLIYLVSSRSGKGNGSSTSDPVSGTVSETSEVSEISEVSEASETSEISEISEVSEEESIAEVSKDPSSVYGDLDVYPESVTDGTIRYVTAENGLRLRSGPGTGYEILASMTYRSKATVLYESSGWSFVHYGNQYGWCSSEYLTDQEPEA